MKKLFLIAIAVLGTSFASQAQSNLEGVFFSIGGVQHGVYSPDTLDKCYGSLGTEGTDYVVVSYSLASDGSTITIGNGSPTPIAQAFRANYVSTFASSARIIRFTNANNQTLGGVPTLSESN